MAGTIRIVNSNLLDAPLTRTVVKHNKYRFDKLDSVSRTKALEIPATSKASLATIRSAAYKFAEDHGYKFATRTTDNSIHVFRVA